MVGLDAEAMSGGRPGVTIGRDLRSDIEACLKELIQEPIVGRVELEHGRCGMSPARKVRHRSEQVEVRRDRHRGPQT